MKKLAVLGVVIGLAAGGVAETVVDVTGVGAEKISVSVDVANAAYAKCLKRNLEVSGLFSVQPQGQVKVSGAPGAIVATGRGKQISSSETAGDDKGLRMAARRLADAMCETFGGGKGFACSPIAFVNRKGKDNAELCMCYPDGMDIRQLTGDGRAIVGPRWKNDHQLYYTFLKNGPQIYEYDLNAQTRKLRWSVKGLSTGAAVSPDGTKVAVVMSFQGNPELYLIEGTRYRRLTNTPNASEGQPTWSPDGRQIAYVSDESRHPQIYVMDLASGKKRRLTTKGSQNVDPDWGRDGRIAYVTRRGGAQIAVMDAAKGDSSAQMVTEAGTWEHPSWAGDARHVVASRDKALFIVDTLEGGDKPRTVFIANGNWITPTWRR